jgi:hypothetical protein
MTIPFAAHVAMSEGNTLACGAVLEEHDACVGVKHFGTFFLCVDLRSLCYGLFGKWCDRTIGVMICGRCGEYV